MLPCKTQKFLVMLNLMTLEYFAIPGKVPSPEDFYELIFMTEEGMKTFEVSVFEYNVVDVGMEGTLVFQGYQLLSFGDWIKEFSL